MKTFFRFMRDHSHAPLKLVLPVGIALVILIIGGAILKLKQNDASDRPQRDSDLAFIETTLRDQDNDGLSDEKETELGTSFTNPDTDGDGFLDGEEVRSGYSPLESSLEKPPINDSPQAPEQNVELNVQWFPKLPPRLEINTFKEGVFIFEKNHHEETATYEVGTVLEGPYANFSVLLSIIQGMWIYNQTFLAKQDSKEDRFINGYLVILPHDGQKPVEPWEVQATFIGLEPPDTLNIPRSKLLLERDGSGMQDLTETYQRTSAFTTPDGKAVYFEKESGCPFVEKKNFTPASYHFKLDFAREDGLLDLTFPDGEKNTGQYEFIARTCGGGCTRYTFVDQTKINPKTDFVLASKTPQGDEFYQLKNKNHPFLKAFFTQNKDWFFGEVRIDEQKTLAETPYDEFIASHPFLFWQDPFGRWIQFQNKIFQSPAEMCKPVVYLYPEQTTHVNVQVVPTGGISIAEPVYPENGWDVIAEPSGTLTDVHSQKQYSSLLWEGSALRFQTPTSGFVVPRNEVPELLEEKLTLLGLNEKEIKDFSSYWLPRMRSSPYYFITFVDQNDIERYAPLTITPSPETLIRVFMDYRGLQKPIDVSPLAIAPVKRKGFTVVEWGGTPRE